MADSVVHGLGAFELPEVGTCLVMIRSPPPPPILPLKARKSCDLKSSANFVLGLTVFFVGVDVFSLWQDGAFTLPAGVDLAEAGMRTIQPIFLSMFQAVMSNETDAAFAAEFMVCA